MDEKKEALLKSMQVIMKYNSDEDVNEIITETTIPENYNNVISDNLLKKLVHNQYKSYAKEKNEK